MPPVKRAVYGVAVAVLALWPVSAVAAPTPSPSLQSILAAAPSAYTTAVNGPFSGNITAAAFAESWGQDSAQASSELNTDGFVAGYGILVGDRATGRIMEEWVLAFTGQSGALRFMGADNRRNVTDTTFQHVDTHTGLGPYYYGVHMATTSPVLVLDGFEFVKGNDMFGIAFYSPKDDVLAVATAQSQKQYDAAPASTISSDDWPENQAPPSRGTTFGEFSPTVAISILALCALFGAGIFLAMRRRETSRLAGAPQPVQQMSGDGNFWWGGSSWISVNDVAPPWSQRSPDGAYWWDGRAWRPVPGAVQLTPR